MDINLKPNKADEVPTVRIHDTDRNGGTSKRAIDANPPVPTATPPAQGTTRNR